MLTLVHLGQGLEDGGASSLGLMVVEDRANGGAVDSGSGKKVSFGRQSPFSPFPLPYV